MTRIETDDLIGQLVDPGSWRSWDIPVPEGEGLDDSYVEELADTRGSTGLDEAVTTGSARIGEHPVAVVAGDFRFLAGSVGKAAAGRLIAAFERATSLGLPVIGLPVSGGTRVQEGTPAFLPMAAIAAAVRRHVDTGLPYLVYLRHPTMGGVFATWGSLGDVTFAQHEALIGFLGPRVYEGLYGKPFPEDVQTAESLAACGVIDGVADPPAWRQLVADLLATWHARPAGRAAAPWEPASGATRAAASTPASRLRPPGEEVSGWEAVTRTRSFYRPGLHELLECVADPVLLHGTQAGESAKATALVIGSVGGVGCVIVGQDREAQAAQHLIGPADLRLARRGMALAERWGLPLVTVVDTQGGELSSDAERGALAGEVGRCLSDMSALATPTLALLLGGGAGGVALALLPADRVLAVSDGWVTPLPPEGASLIRFRTPDRADDMADHQRITAAQLHDIGAVDRVIAPPTADMAEVAAAVGEELARLTDGTVETSVRTGKWAGLGRVVD